MYRIYTPDGGCWTRISVLIPRLDPKKKRMNKIKIASYIVHGDAYIVC
jgi:hypothetical protein